MTFINLDSHAVLFLVHKSGDWLLKLKTWQTQWRILRLYRKCSVSSAARMSCVSQLLTASCITVTGPLNSTVRDFWQMVVEQGSTLVVMVTTLVERGRTKCHKYWPALGETLELLSLQLTCNKEEADSTGSFVFREFILRDLLVSWYCNLWGEYF